MAFLEGKLTNSTYIDLPPGLVDLGFITKEDYADACIKLNGGMYGNVDSALMNFVRFKDYATSKNGLNLKQSLTDPCLFYEKDEEGILKGVIVVYIDDCLIAGKGEFIQRMKEKLKQEFGVVEDGRLRKLLGVQYEWLDMDSDTDARVVLSMEDKAVEIVHAFNKARGYIPKNYSTSGKPGEVLQPNASQKGKKAV